MKKQLKIKSGLLAGICALVLAGSASAADLATAAGIMTEVESLAVSAKAAVAAAALSGDTAAVAEAQRRANAIDSAVASARQSYAAVETNINNGDMDAADSAQDDLAAALAQAQDASKGIISASASSQSASSENAGSGPGYPDDPPNIEEVPWQSDGMKAYYQGLFGTIWSSSSYGNGAEFGDRDATPE